MHLHPLLPSQEYLKNKKDFTEKDSLRNRAKLSFGSVPDSFEKTTSEKPSAEQSKISTIAKEAKELKQEFKQEIKESAKKVENVAKKEVTEASPVTFEYYPDKPNIKRKININFSCYKNILHLSQDFYDKYVDSAVKDLFDFAFTIEHEKQGIPVEYPNCILIEDPADKIADDLIKMTKDMSDIDYVAIEGKEGLKCMEALDTALEKAKENYQKTSRRTLLKVDNLDNLIKVGQPFEHTEWMKGIMTSSATDYYTTIIFKTKNSYKLVEETIASHRCGIKCFPHAVDNKILEKEALAERKLINKQNLEQKTNKSAKYQEKANEVKQEAQQEIKQELKQEKVKEIQQELKQELKQEIKESAKKVENVAKKEVIEKATDIAKKVPQKAGGAKGGGIRGLLFWIFSGGLLAGIVKYKDEIIGYWKGIINASNSNSQQKH